MSRVGRSGAVILSQWVFEEGARELKGNMWREWKGAGEVEREGSGRRGRRAKWAGEWTAGDGEGDG